MFSHAFFIKKLRIIFFNLNTNGNFKLDATETLLSFTFFAFKKLTFFKFVFEFIENCIRFEDKSFVLNFKILFLFKFNNCKLLLLFLKFDLFLV